MDHILCEDWLAVLFSLSIFSSNILSAYYNHTPIFLQAHLVLYSLNLWTKPFSQRTQQILTSRVSCITFRDLNKRTKKTVIVYTTKCSINLVFFFLSAKMAWYFSNMTKQQGNQGAILWGSRGKSDVFRMLLSAQNSITTRSNPTPNPPWVGAPYLQIQKQIC